MKMNYLKDKIEDVLKNNTQARDDDALLIFKVWQNMQYNGQVVIRDYIYQLLRKYRPDSITRIRRKFQADGMYVASQDKQKQRRANEVYLASVMSAPDPEIPVWTQRDGNKILVSDMNYKHLENAHGYLQDLGWTTQSERERINAWINILEYELNQRDYHNR